MLTNYFRLNPIVIETESGSETIPHVEFNSELGLTAALKTSKHLRDFIYRSDTLNLAHPDNLFADLSFTNVSFKSTTVIGIIFRDCRFEDCLFTFTTFVD